MASSTQPHEKLSGGLSSWLPSASWLAPASRRPQQGPPSTAAPAQPALSEQAAEAEKNQELFEEVTDLTGQWEKDTSASDMDAYARQVAMLHMSSVQTFAALHFMWGLAIKTDETGMTLKFLVKKVPAFVFREVEHFKFGEPTTMGRRDRRSGQQTGTLERVDGGVKAVITWGDPYAGTTEEVYTLKSPTELHLLSTVTIGGETVSSLQVYNKR